MNPGTLTVHPCAKINLGLYVTGRRPDGYHTLETIFVPVTLFDRIDFIVREKNLTLHCSAPSVPKDETNLVIRAVNAFLKNWGAGPPDFGLEITLKKNIPSGSGLGGGSSDAAYTLLALQKLFGNPLDPETLRRIAVTLGADVPFFLESRICLGEGIGEILTPLDIRIPGRILLVMPEIHISTAEVFRSGNFALTNKNKLVTLSRKDKLKNIFSLFPELANELEAVVFSMHPELREIKNSLYSKGAFYAGMTGSGSAFFGIFEGDQEAEEAFLHLSPYYPTANTRQYVPHI